MKLMIDISEKIYDTIIDDEMPTEEQMSAIVTRIYQGTPVQTGEWIEDSGNIACSCCHTIWLYRRTKFCPECGAKMKKEGEEE